MGALIALVFQLAVLVFYAYCAWRIFTKANEPGWAALIPIYNGIVTLKIVGKPVWWIVLFLVPIVNFVASIVVAISLAKSFGKSTAFGIGLAFLGFIFFPVLALGDAKYQGPAG